MRTVGICFGAVTAQWVRLEFDAEKVSIIEAASFNHQGDLNFALNRLEPVLKEGARIAVTGRSFRHALCLTSISEPQAIEQALQHEFKGKNLPDALVSCGGENIIAYVLTNRGGISSVRTGGKCASGTGEFLVQQAGRMNMSVEQAVRAAQKGVARKIAGRCSVFCKSDCTHALNKGEPRQNICAGLCQMMADKITELLKAVRPERVLLTGGVTRNGALVEILRKRITKVIVPVTAVYYEAFGAALWAKENQCLALPEKKRLIKKMPRTFLQHPALAGGLEFVDFKNQMRDKAKTGDICVLGLDVGSTTTKGVLLRAEDKKIIASVYLRTNADPVEASRKCYSSLKNELKGIPISIIGMAATGSGRRIAALYAQCPVVINEIIAHAASGAYFDPEADTIFEIGGQDAKYTYLSKGVPCDYAMNEACSAGTGSFLEEAAEHLLNVNVRGIAELALLSEAVPDFNDQCAAFISSDIKLASQQGMGKNDILAGLVYSVCLNYLTRVKASRRVGKRILMQGGVCYNRAVPAAMASLLKKRITVPPDPGLMGAYGVGLKFLERLKQGSEQEKEYFLDKLIKSEARQVGKFNCPGSSNCDRKCEISRIKVNDKVYPFGGACGKYNEARQGAGAEKGLDLVCLRQKLLFDKGIKPVSKEDASRPSVGLSRSFLTQSLYPFYSHFFHNIGFDIILSKSDYSAGLDRKNAQFCLPAGMAHGWFLNLLNESPDYIFLPHLKGLPVKNSDPRQSALCPIVQGEQYYLRSAFEKEISRSRSVIVSPVLALEYGYSNIEKIMINTACEMGATAKEAKKAFMLAKQAQLDFESQLKETGKKAIERAKQSGSMMVVILGRAYNAFCAEANMSIPAKIACRNFGVIAYDMLPTDDLALNDKMYWASGQNILKSAQIIKENDFLFGFYVTNFSCGPDSFILKSFSRKMGNKPSLILELDEHTADAGIDTRIEAALEIMSAYRKEQNRKQSEEAEDFRPCLLTKNRVIDNKGLKHHLRSKNVEILFPSMGSRGTEMLAAVFRRAGFNAKALSCADRKALSYGKSESNCKECLPYILTLGSFLSYLKEQRSNGQISMFFMVTGGPPCRLGKYAYEMEQVIGKNRINNAGVFALDDCNGFTDIGLNLFLKALKAIIVSDVLEDVRSMLCVMAKDKKSALEVFEECFQEVVRYFEDKCQKEPVLRLLSSISERLSKIPKRLSIEEAPKISLVGEIFVRRSEFTNSFVIDYLERQGFAVMTAPVMEYLWYMNHCIRNEQNPLFLKMLGLWVGSWVNRWEREIKNALQLSGFYKTEMIDINRTLKGVRHIIGHDFASEATLTTAAAMKEVAHLACGVISIGPFGCMASRPAEAILKTQMNPKGKSRMACFGLNENFFKDDDQFPFFAIEADGSAYPQIVEANLEAFVLQARRLHGRMMRKNS